MKTRKLLLSLIAILCFFFLTASPASAGKSYFADQYDVIIVVQPDGALNITETVVFSFEGGPFTYVNRDLEYANLDEIDRLQASMDGRVLSQGTQPGQVEIAVGHPLKVTWHFPSTSDSTHEFTLTYQVHGAIRQDAAADTLIWRAIPEDHKYSIARSTIRLEYPAGITPLSTPSLAGVSAEYEAGDQATVFNTQQIDTDTPADISAHFPPGSLITKPPAWQSLQAQKDHQISNLLPFGLGAAVLTGVVGLAWLMLVKRGFRREAIIFPEPTQNYSAPPQHIPPALAARLIDSSTSFLGTLFDLARRGVLQIEEGPKKWGSRTFEVVRQPSNERLQPHEQVFYDALFLKAKNGRTALSAISSLASNSRFSQALDQELTTAGWRDAQRSARRSRFLALSGLALGMGIMVFLAGLLLAGSMLITNPAGAALGAMLMGTGAAASGVGLLGLLAAALISTLSDEGVRQASAWKSFSGYLRNITRDREPVVAADIFERYLPYAAGFGFATEWAKYFQKTAGIPVPEWFHGLQSSLDDGSFIAIIAAISAADSSASAATGGDGGGASGGGSSGAG